MARLDRRSLRTLRALARAAATSRAAIVGHQESEAGTVRRTVDVLALAFDAPRWTVATWSRAAGSLRVLGLERIRSVRPTAAPAGPPPEGFDALDFAVRRYLAPEGGPAWSAAFLLADELAPLLPALLPTAVATPTPAGLACRLRTSRAEVVAGLVDSLGGSSALDSCADMAPSKPGKKPTATEARLLGVVTFILSRSEPVTRRELYEAFPDDYAGSAEAKEKKFTRDKDAIERLGYAIETVEVGGKDQTAYAIDPCAYALPPIDLGPDEAAVVWAAAAAALRFSSHPLREDLEAALRKLLVGARGLPPPAAAPEELGTAPDRKADRVLEKLVSAWERRKRVTLTYWKVGDDAEVERQVDVYGWASRRGEWLFAGWCHLRKAVRVFYLSRVRALKVNVRAPGKPDYDIPAEFDIRRFSRQQIWDYVVHPPRLATVRFTGSLAPLARQLLPGAKVVTDTDGARVARLEVRNLRGLVRQALAWGPEAELLEPPEGRALAREILAATAPGTTGEAA
jgi:proteasome accessory factor B